MMSCGIGMRCCQGACCMCPMSSWWGTRRAWSRRLLQHCGLPWDDSVLEFHKTERDVQTASLSQARGCSRSPGPFIMRWEHACQRLRPAVARVCPGA